MSTAFRMFQGVSNVWGTEIEKHLRKVAYVPASPLLKSAQVDEAVQTYDDLWQELYDYNVHEHELRAAGDRGALRSNPGRV